MSSINLQLVVQQILSEVTYLDQEQTDQKKQTQSIPKVTGNYPQWFDSILKQHEKLGLGHVNNESVKLLFNIGVKPYISQEEARQVSKYILILDVIKYLYDQATPKPTKNLNIFLNAPQIEQAGEELAKEISTYTNKKQWIIQTPQVANAYKSVKPTPLGVLSKAAGALGALRVGMGPVG